MELWKTRHHSMEMLAKDFKEQGKAIEAAFGIIDECIDLFNAKAGNDEFHRICGLVLAKARNYALGSYGLILDGLGQEAGALIRPFIEYLELLTYFRLAPTRVRQVIDNTLPSAGERAKLIEGHFGDYRKYLNDHASHSSFSYYALNHLLDKPEMIIRKEQPMLPKVLFVNMGSLFVQLILIAIEAINCLETAAIGSAHKQACAIDQLRTKGFALFKKDEPKKDELA